MNIKRKEVFKRFVADLATLSKCTDKKVACILTDKEGTQVYSIGVNGGPKGGDDCLCKLGGKYTCVHAEANAVAKCTSTDPHKVAFCTLSPCVTCAALLLNVGIAEVYYIDKYKDGAGVKMLKNAGVHVQCLSDDEAYRDETETLLQRLIAGGTAYLYYNDQNLDLLRRLNDLCEADNMGVVECTFMGVPVQIMEVRWKANGRD